MLECSRPKRNYIRRKKYLNDSTALIKLTLRFIDMNQGSETSPTEIDRLANQHAISIEAACWDPRISNITDELYQRLMLTRTRQLCICLLCRNLPQMIPAQFLCDVIARIAPRPPPPSASLPILKQPVITEPSRPWPEEPSFLAETELNLEPLDLPKNPFGRDDIFFETDSVPESLCQLDS
jgi:hypothetical protein